jgi:cysteinyl-tRNA synthetase
MARAMSETPPLMLFNSLTRQLEPFQPIHPGEARVYSCGPTVYNYPHIGNMRAYVFADTLGRVLAYKGYRLRHVINITDVGHLTDDADAGEDKLEKMAAARAQSIWDIARHYSDAYWADFKALNCRQPHQWTIATDYVPQMIDFAASIAEEHCYQIDSGLYFDVTTVPDYGRLARAATEEGQSRIDPVPGKRNAMDFAIWRTTPPGETRQMEWDSPWGRGAPGWHLECSVMSGAVLGFPFDIHTGGIDHREIHHPCEIAQNQAICGSEHPGANLWMHNNFLIDRTGKMSKSSGDFLRLQLLVDRGFHPLAYRLMCLQAHYRSELEFSWEGLQAAFVRLKRMVMGVEKLRAPAKAGAQGEAAPGSPGLLPSQEHGGALDHMADADLADFSRCIADDLNTAMALPLAEALLNDRDRGNGRRLAILAAMDSVLGLNLLTLTRADLRIRPVTATITEEEIEAALAERRAARAAKDFARSDAIRDDLIARGVEVMDGDPLGWDWRIDS